MATVERTGAGSHAGVTPTSPTVPASGTSLPFADVAEVSRLLAATPSRLAKTRIAAELLARTPAEDTEVVLHLLAGGLRQRRTGVGWATARDLPAPAAAPTLTVAEVDGAFAAAAAAAGPGAGGTRAGLWQGLVSRATADEQRLLVGLATGDVRQGAAAGVLTEAVAAAGGAPADDVRRAVTVAGDLVAVGRALLLEGPGALAAFAVRPGVALAPMLAGTAPDVAAALERTGPAHVDWKLDGVRAQAHVLGDGTVRLFSRSLDDITGRAPEVVAALSAVGPCVLDGELVVLDPGGAPRPFQETSSRVARAGGGAGEALTYVAFDSLHSGTAVLVDTPLSERRAALERLLPPLPLDGSPPPPAAVAPVLRCPGGAADAAAAGAFARRALALGHEGVVVKAAGSGYAAGRRGTLWVKVKPVETLDLVVLAAEWGSGRRTGRLSNLHLGARDPDGHHGPPGGWVMLGKTFKGLTDAMLEWQTAHLLDLAVDRGSWVVRVRPELVVEIALDGVQTSSRYPGGMALRFARVVRHRPDKPAAEADAVDAVRALHRAASPGHGATA